jgi:hypothetical protein
LRIPDSDSLNVGGPYDAKTLAIAFRPDDVDSRQVIYEQGGAWRGLNIYIEDGAVHAAFWDQSSGNSLPLTLNEQVSPGKTHTITLRMDANAGKLSGYLDGKLLGTETNVTSLGEHGDDIGLGAMVGDTVFEETGPIRTDTVKYNFDGALSGFVSANQAWSLSTDTSDIF